MAIEIQQLATPAHCRPAASGTIHIPAEVRPTSHPLGRCGASQVPAKPMAIAATPSVWKAAFMAMSPLVDG
jgi:hypothetical protein